RKDVDATVVRAAGQIYQTQPDGRLSNLYSIKLANKTRKDLPITLKVENMDGDIAVVGTALHVGPESYLQTPFFVKIDPGQIARRKTKIMIGVYQGHKRITTAETTFMGPGN
ncbi:MAG: cytochrome c oxidase accessory protein CcoG, partial [Gammaproteobacteria bacterium]